MSTSVPHISDHICTFKLPFGIEELRSIFPFTAGVRTVDVAIALVCFSVQGQSTAVFVVNEYSVTCFSEGLRNNKYPTKCKVATITTKAKRRLPNNLLPKIGTRQRAISLKRPSISRFSFEAQQYKWTKDCLVNPNLVLWSLSKKTTSSKSPKFTN